MEDPQAKLGRMYIEEYLRNKGHTWESVRALPEEAAKKIMVEASTYAAIKLSEVDARANVVRQIHDAQSS
jgi:hypothetical protein